MEFNPFFRHRFRTLLLALFSGLSMLSIPLRAETYCVDYRYHPNQDNFRVRDFAILSPYCQVDMTEGHRLGKKFYAYISASEVAHNAQYYQAAQNAGIPYIGENPNWNSHVVDVASPLWAPFVINQLARPAVDQGYDGFFLDTMDSYYLTSHSWALQEAGLVTMVTALKAAYPTKKIIINRGFPMWDRLKTTVDGMLVEGLYYSWPGEPQESSDTTWLLGQLNRVKAAGKSVYILDYLPEPSVSLAVQVANQIKAQGFVPAVVHEDLDGTVLAPAPEQGQTTAPPLRIDQFLFKNGRPCIRFTAQASTAYSVEYSDQPQGNVWRSVGVVPPLTTTRAVEVSDSTAAFAPSRFYRLRVLP